MKGWEYSYIPATHIFLRFECANIALLFYITRFGPMTSTKASYLLADILIISSENSAVNIFK